MQSETVEALNVGGSWTTVARAGSWYWSGGLFAVEREPEPRRSYWLHGKSFKGLHIAATTWSKIADKECGLVGRKH